MTDPSPKLSNGHARMAKNSIAYKMHAVQHDSNSVTLSSAAPERHVPTSADDSNSVVKRLATTAQTDTSTATKQSGMYTHSKKTSTFMTDTQLSFEVTL
jgi:hypothetical protein